MQPVLEWFPDGESFVSDAPRWNESGLVARPTLRANVRDASAIPLTGNDDRDENVRVSPDGTRILFSRAVRPPARHLRAQELFVLTVAPAGDPGMARPLAGMPGPEEGFISGYCWSPDGAWVAIQLMRTLSEEPAEHELRTEIISLDGTQRRVVHVERTTVLPKGTNYLDWR